MHTNPSTRHLLRNIYLLCAVSAITCAGLVAVFGWRHLQQHQREAHEIHAHTHVFEHVAELQALLLAAVEPGGADDPALHSAAAQLEHVLASNPEEQVLAEEFQKTWQAWRAAGASVPPNATTEQDGTWNALCAVLESISQYHGSQLDHPTHQHAGDAGSIAHLWFGAILLISGVWGVVWLVTSIVRSQRQLLHAQQTLERRVEERTGEIARQNERLSEEVAERRRLQQEILTIASEEQRRIAGWLHDDLGQRLTGLSLSVKTLERELVNNGHATGEETLIDLASQVRSTSETLRMIVRGLYPTTMTTSELVAAVEALATDARERANCRCAVRIEAVPDLHDDASNVQLYGILREAFTNAIRHAGAREVRITMAPSDGQLVVSIVDDGCGFELEHASEQGVGLQLMRYRADILRARLEVHSAPDTGTRVQVSVPIPAPA